MTIEVGVLVLIIVGLAWKMRGAQLPHVLLGMMLMAAATAGSAVDQIGVTSLDVFTSLLDALFSAVGQGNLV